MTQCLSRSDKNEAKEKLKSLRDWQNGIQEYLDPPKPLNLTLLLFFGGYLLAIISIWQWYQGNWPLPILVALAFLARVIAFSMDGRSARALAKVVVIRPFSIREQDKLAIKEMRCAVFTPRRWLCLRCLILRENKR